MAFQFECPYKIDVMKKLDSATRLGAIMFEGDNESNVLKLQFYRDYIPFDMTGHSVVGLVIRADGGTVYLNEGVTVEDNRVSIPLPQSCFAVIGQITISVRTIKDGVKTVVFHATGTVVRSSTDTIIDPGHVVPSVEDVIAKMDEMDAKIAETDEAIEDAEEATANANGAAEKAVRYDIAQTLSEVQRMQARANIGAMVVTVNGEALVVTSEGAGDYEQWSWSSRSTGANKLEAALHGTRERSDGQGHYRIEYRDDATSFHTRGFFVLGGNTPLVSAVTGEDTEYYPIPVPHTATKLRAILADSSMYVCVYLYQYIGDGLYNLISTDRKSTRLNSSHAKTSRMPSSA